MDDEYKGKVFKSGNSAALRLPKAFGLPEGTEVRMIREAPMTFRVEAIDAPKRTINGRKFIGKCPDLKPWPREDFDDRPRAWDVLDT
ncbi:MAG: AbrB/MazE/SpoVT family DNA-binding domain-containing protein [Sphingomonadales bacterium]|jgi:antitoxin VapB|nr:AbrB/MazE/SpoVT family DNA-binding domain-containing protein [Sphingomonadales bacterium]